MNSDGPVGDHGGRGWTRRRLLAGVAGSLPVLAGCTRPDATDRPRRNLTRAVGPPRSELTTGGSDVIHGASWGSLVERPDGPRLELDVSVAPHGVERLELRDGTGAVATTPVTTGSETVYLTGTLVGAYEFVAMRSGRRLDAVEAVFGPRLAVSVRAGAAFGRRSTTTDGTPSGANVSPGALVVDARSTGNAPVWLQSPVGSGKTLGFVTEGVPHPADETRFEGPRTGAPDVIAPGESVTGVLRGHRRYDPSEVLLLTYDEDAGRFVETEPPFGEKRVASVASGTTYDSTFAFRVSVHGPGGTGIRIPGRLRYSGGLAVLDRTGSRRLYAPNRVVSRR